MKHCKGFRKQEAEMIESIETAQNEALELLETRDTYIRTLHETGSLATLGSIGHADGDLETAPVFSWSVKQQTTASKTQVKQYGLLGHEVPSSGHVMSSQLDPIFLNIDAPWSAFICGSQGSGKSHTLSCMLENCLLRAAQLGKLTAPPSGILFHYDMHNANVPCEAAYLASHVPVSVLVSPSNYWQRSKVYQGLNPKIKVRPLLLQDHHLSIQRMHRLMAFKQSDGSVPLYMEVITRILRELAIESRGSSGLDYTKFLARLAQAPDMTPSQRGPLNLRMGLLGSFLANSYPYKKTFGLSSGLKNQDVFSTDPGSLTIVDLSDALIDPPSACTLFDMCLALFFEGQAQGSKIVALDEAHKFMTATDASDAFTASLLQIVREQRHKGARVIISTQEPTISSSLLDLCSMTFVHRFSSPSWLAILRQHLAGASMDNNELLDEIVSLHIGESLLFAPTAVLRVEEDMLQRLGTRRVRVKTRQRITGDGGRSVMASARGA